MTYPTDATDNAAIRTHSPGGERDDREGQKKAVLNAIRDTLDAFEREPDHTLPTHLAILINTIRAEAPSLVRAPWTTEAEAVTSVERLARAIEKRTLDRLPRKLRRIVAELRRARRAC